MTSSQPDRDDRLQKKTEPSVVLAGCVLFKWLLSAKKSWPRLNGSQRIADVIQGVRFEDGMKPSETPPDRAITNLWP